MTTVNITTSTGDININYNTDQTINPNPELLNNNPSNVYIPIKVCKTCRTIKYITEFYKDKFRYDEYYKYVNIVKVITIQNIGKNFMNKIKKN